MIQVVDTVDYSDISGFPLSTVDGHKGRFVFGYIQETPVVIMQGRVHFYEGYEISDVVLPIRVMRKLGADILFLTNSAGGLNTMYRPGDFMMITDHIGSFMPSPLIGENVEVWKIYTMLSCVNLFASPRGSAMFFCGKASMCR